MKKRKRRKRRRPPPGSAPGTLAVDPESPAPQMSVIAFRPDEVVERDLRRPDEIDAFLASWPVVWLNVSGLGNPELIRNLGDRLGIHPLALADALHVHQRAKIEEYENALFIVARMPGGHDPADTEQLSLFLDGRLVLTFQEQPGDCFDPVRARIRQGRGRIRALGPDYLAYALLDSVVDAFFPVVERCGEELEALEEELLGQARKETISRVYQTTHALATLRSVIWPAREKFRTLSREELPFITEETRLFLRDCHDHTIQLIDLLENYKDFGAAIMQLHVSMASQRMNEVMKFLTVIATIFIPLTFIVGVYGMNFDTKTSPWNMPELRWYFGYPLCLAAMLVVSVVQIVYFVRKKWL